MPILQEILNFLRMVALLLSLLMQGKLRRMTIQELISFNGLNRDMLGGGTFRDRALTYIPGFPYGLTELNLSNCIRLTTLPALPAGLRVLNLGECSSLTTLPDLPAGLRVLNLEGCSSLAPSVELLARLQALEARGCSIRYPRHVSIGTQSERLTERLAAVIQGSPLEPKSRALPVLLHRFLSEGLGQRGGVLTICTMVEPIVKFFEHSPHHLSWADDIASGFLDGCVNQPVRGWSEIAAWMSVAQASAFSDKVQAVRYPLALRTIEKIIARNPPGPGVEVESANALLSKGYYQLKESGRLAEDWPCIPQGVAYEGMIQDWLTDEKARDFVETIQKCSDEKLVQFVSNTVDSSIWGAIVFPEAIQAIHKKYSDLQENYDALLRILESPQEEAAILKEFKSPERLKSFNQFQESVSSLGIEALHENAGALMNQREAELATTLSTLTQERFQAPSAAPSPYCRWSSFCCC